MRCSGWIRFGRIAVVFLVLASAARLGNAAVGQARPVGSSVAQAAPASLWEQLQVGLGNLLQLLGFGGNGGHAKAAAANCSANGNSNTSDGTSPSGQGGVQPGDLFPGIDPNGGLRAGGN